MKAYGGFVMLKIIRRKYPLSAEGQLNNAKNELATEKQRNDDLEAAIVELAELFAEQDDAIIELAELIGG